MTQLFGRDPTRPIAPAFTTNRPRVDIMERQANRRRKGGLMAPMLFARMEAKKKGTDNAGPA